MGALVQVQGVPQLQSANVMDLQERDKWCSQGTDTHTHTHTLAEGLLVSRSEAQAKFVKETLSKFFTTDTHVSKGALCAFATRGDTANQADERMNPGQQKRLTTQGHLGVTGICRLFDDLGMPSLEPMQSGPLRAPCRGALPCWCFG